MNTQLALIRKQFLEAVNAGPGQLESYLNGVAASRSRADFRAIKACIDAAVRTVLGPHCTVQYAGSTDRGVAIEEVGLMRG
jgi:hypothetical protein